MLFGNTEYINVMSVEVKIAKSLEFTRGIYLPCNKDHGLDFISFLKHQQSINQSPLKGSSGLCFGGKKNLFCILRCSGEFIKHNASFSFFAFLNSLLIKCYVANEICQNILCNGLDMHHSSCFLGTSQVLFTSCVHTWLESNEIGKINRRLPSHPMSYSKSQCNRLKWVSLLILSSKIVNKFHI